MLSIQQTRIFLLQKYFENKPLYNMTFLVDLDGTIDTKILEKSINFLCLIEPVLNTNIKLIDGYPQVFFNKNKIKIEETVINYQIKENELKNYIFDLGNDKLFKLVYCKKDSKIICLFHDLIIDGKTILIFFDKLSIIYNNFIKNRLPKLKKNDYYSQKFKYNIDEIRDILFKENFIEFPIEKNNIKPFDFEEDRIYFEITPNLFIEINKFIHKREITIFQLFQSILFLLINRYSNNIKVSIDTIFDCSKDNSIGLYNNTVIIPYIFKNKDLTVLEYLDDIKKINKIIMDNKNIPLEYIINKLELQSLPNIRLHFEFINREIKFNFNKTNITSNFMENTTNIIRQLFWFNFGVHKNHIEAYISYRKNLYSKETIIELKNNFIKILKLFIFRKNDTLNTINENIEIVTNFSDKIKNNNDFRFEAYKYAGNYPDINYDTFKKIINLNI